jgi:NagD protein
MFRAARKRIGLRTDEVVVIGDTMETDIRGAVDLGFESVLVLTGSTERNKLKEYPFRPALVVESIGELAAAASEGSFAAAHATGLNSRRWV